MCACTSLALPLPARRVRPSWRSPSAPPAPPPHSPPASPAAGRAWRPTPTPPASLPTRPLTRCTLRPPRGARRPHRRCRRRRQGRVRGKAHGTVRRRGGGHGRLGRRRPPRHCLLPALPRQVRVGAVAPRWSRSGGHPPRRRGGHPVLCARARGGVPRHPHGRDVHVCGGPPGGGRRLAGRPAGQRRGDDAGRGRARRQPAAAVVWGGPDRGGHPEATADPASGVEATVAFRLRFPPGGCAAAAGGVAADFSFDFCAGAAARKVDELVLTGTAASARLSVLGVPGAVTVTPADGGAPTAVSFPAPAHVQQPLIQAVVDEWTGGAGAPRQPSPAGPAVRTSELVDEVLRGVYGPRGMGFWETWTKPVGRGAGT
ncbi:hypothetical protein BU14_0602s0012 [Porphyra umbilicalis]|uniref:Uncharacterized protein n=1 Tax=Porphyra umbilicalis TaxID=2786 RepID=A0A1X6NRU3_PORUM|nr:hypothetical protein BU14_0602s0012 [Porphyra umbilicalis]|eukprot:OSX71103.1 hypothetical protein BU14_0602s0012 [Porphyra umbilicalis]